MTRAAGSETTIERLIRLQHERAQRTVEALAHRERKYASGPRIIDVTIRTHTPEEHDHDAS